MVFWLNPGHLFWKANLFAWQLMFCNTSVEKIKLKIITKARSKFFFLILMSDRSNPMFV
jgi:hypothetical protein